jgi:acetylornithine/succinyldiaminopimelate/putrescine aminotransferase
MTNRQLFLQNVAQTSDFPLMLEIEKAEGVYLYSANGEKYIDLISGIGVSNVGHRHPKVVQAIKDQVDKYLHLMVYGEYVQSPQVLLAQKLASLLPQSLSSVYFTNSGSEAIEGAMKLAKRYSGRGKIISCYDAYHGSTHGALSIGGNEKLKQNFRPLLPLTNRIHFGQENELDNIDAQTAAVVVETVQGEAGVRVASPEYFKKLRRKCDEQGALLVLDEIQCGFGRTGKFWAFEHYGITPDILVCAKGMGGGMPLGAFISSVEIMSVLKHNPILGHITTFGGHPVCCAASLATIETIQQEKLIEQVAEKAQLFLSMLQHPKIKASRNKGLMMAFEMENFETLKPVIDKAIKKGVITDWFLFCDNSMRVAPPLTISNKEIIEACEHILEAIKEA